MDVIVKYSDYNEVINEIQLPISDTQRKVIKITTDAVLGEVVQLDTVDDTVSFTVTQKMTKAELRDYVQLLQRLLMQMA